MSRGSLTPRDETVVPSKHTPGPWGWVIHDHSMASLGVLPDPGLGDPLVLSVGPCPACAGRASPREWKWGRCCTPSEADASLLAAAPDLLSLAQSLPVMLALAAKLHPDSPINWGQFEKDANEAIAKAGG